MLQGKATGVLSSITALRKLINHPRLLCDVIRQKEVSYASVATASVTAFSIHSIRADLGRIPNCSAAAAIGFVIVESQPNSCCFALMAPAAGERRQADGRSGRLGGDPAQVPGGLDEGPVSLIRCSRRSQSFRASSCSSVDWWMGAARTPCRVREADAWRPVSTPICLPIAALIIVFATANAL